MERIDYNQYLIKKPILTAEPNAQNPEKNSLSFIYMNRTLVPEVRYYLEFGWASKISQNNQPNNWHAHPYDEIILNIGMDHTRPEELGAEMEYSIGGQRFTIDTTSAIFVPRGIKHGWPVWKDLQRPHVQIHIGLAPEKEYIKPQDLSADENSSKRSFNAESYVVRKPAYEVVALTPTKNRQAPSSMTLMSNNLVPGSNIYIETGWVWGMPDPNPHIFEHVHDYEEIVIHFGNDHRNPEVLGAEIEFDVGGQPLKVDKTSAVYVPPGVKHGPLIWKQYSSPHLEMAIMPGAGTLDEADPGGHREKMKGGKSNG